MDEDRSMTLSRSSNPARTHGRQAALRGGDGWPGQSSPVRAGRSRFRRAVAWLEDSWVGDLIGVVCLFAAGWLGLVIVGVLQ
jgi:hypothetical protein